MIELDANEVRAKTVFDRLIQRAFTEGYLIGNPTVRRCDYLRWSGEEWPDHLLPGRLLGMLTKREREALKYLHSNLINDRQL